MSEYMNKKLVFWISLKNFHSLCIEVYGETMIIFFFKFKTYYTLAYVDMG